jgi:BolA protein
MDTSAGADTRTRIHEKLAGAFEPDFVDVLDQSAAHAGHAGAASGGGHFRVLLVSKLFEGLNPVQRQRRVYEVLQDEMAGAVHALSMTCLTPAEYDGEN